MKKRLTAILLALVLALSLVPGAFAADLAKASTQSVEVDGAKIEFQMYALVDANGGETNYVKLRDVAHVLNSTPAKFSVGYDGTISITTGESYTDNGSEMTTPYSGDRAYKPGPGAVKVNGADVNLDAIVLTDDNGGAYTYFKLRDLGTALGFTVDWTGERGVFIETGAGTETPASQPQPADPAQPEFVETATALTRYNIEEYLEISAETSDIEIEKDIYEGFMFSHRTFEGTGTLTLTTESKTDGTFADVTIKGYLSAQNYGWGLGSKIPFALSIGSDGAISNMRDNTFDISGKASGEMASLTDDPKYKVEIEEVTGTLITLELVVPEGPDPDVNAEDYAFKSLQYIHNRLKFPDTMQDVSILTGHYSRRGKNGDIYSTTDKYYVVNISCKAANSFGVLTSDTYVFLFNLTTGESDYNWMDRIESGIENAWGERKLSWMKLKTEAIELEAGGQFTALPRETVDRLVTEVKNMG